uniref:Uncharacterized protein n=1 Tax=Kalanchoe fedtschenkoi TaxID=63787 RepID=A0A7N0TGR8_KALFE
MSLSKLPLEETRLIQYSMPDPNLDRGLDPSCSIFCATIDMNMIHLLSMSSSLAAELSTECLFSMSDEKRI